MAARLNRLLNSYCNIWVYCNVCGCQHTASCSAASPSSWLVAAYRWLPCLPKPVQHVLQSGQIFACYCCCCFAPLHYLLILCQLLLPAELNMLKARCLYCPIYEGQCIDRQDHASTMLASICPQCWLQHLRSQRSTWVSMSILLKEKGISGQSQTTKIRGIDIDVCIVHQKLA